MKNYECIKDVLRQKKNSYKRREMALAALAAEIEALEEEVDSLPDDE